MENIRFTNVAAEIHYQIIIYVIQLLIIEEDEYIFSSSSFCIKLIFI